MCIKVDSNADVVKTQQHQRRGGRRARGGGAYPVDSNARAALEEQQQRGGWGVCGGVGVGGVLVGDDGPNSKSLLRCSEGR